MRDDVSRLIPRSAIVLCVRHPQLAKLRAGAGLSEGCPKIGDVPKSPFPSVAALVPSAGTIPLQKKLRSARVPWVSAALRVPFFRRAALYRKAKAMQIPSVLQGESRKRLL